MEQVSLGMSAWTSVIIMLVMYGFLIAEKINRVIVVGVAAMLVILLHLFH